MSDSRLKINLEVDASQADKITSALTKIADSSEKLANKSDSAGKKVAASWAPAGLSIAAVGFAIKKSLDAFNEQDKVMKQTESLLKATSYASGMTSKSLFAMADSLEKVTNFEGEEILGGENTLLRFKNIGQDIFPQATEAMLDMAQVMGKDVSGAAAALGKALQNPLEASGALKKAGVDLTVAQEKQIEKMMKAGDVAGAQKVILEELRNTIGGTARDSLSQWDKMNQGLGDFAKIIGEALLPTVNDLIQNAFIPMMNYLKEHKAGFVALASVVAALGLAFTGPVGIAAAIAVVGTAIYALRQKFKEVFLDISDFAIKSVDTVLSVYSNLFDKIGLTFAKDMVERARAGLQGLRKTIAEEKDKIEADEKKRNAEKDAAEEKRAKDGAAKWKKTKTQDAKDGANKEESNEEEKKLKKWKDMYGDLSKADLKYLRDHEKVNQKANLEQLRDDKKWYDKRSELGANYSEKQKDQIIGLMRDAEQEEEEANKQRLALDLNIGNARLEWSKQFFGTVTTLMQSSNEEMFRIGQAAAIANAVMNVAEGITKAIAQGGFFGLAMGAAVAAAGAVQIAQITAQQPPGYMEGGVIGGFNGATYGPDNTIIAAREGEFVMNAPMQKELYDIAKGRKAVASQPATATQVIYSPKIIINADTSTNGKAVGKIVRKELDDHAKRLAQKAKMKNT